MEFLDSELLLSIVTLLLALSEFLGSFDSIKSNSIFQLAVRLLKSFTGGKNE